jgi:site-specific recombinase XerD
MRGYGVDGIADERFRGRWAARNSGFCDLMVRTGLRLSEQASLTIFDVPLQTVAGYQRFWLPPAIAKGGSARWVYVPASVSRDLRGYLEVDRADVMRRARLAGRYRVTPGTFVVEDPTRPIATSAGGTHVSVASLGPLERRQLLVAGADGLEPASFWLGEAGDPVAVPTWKSVFRQASLRCAGHGLDLRAHPHMLRHTFAVVTLEQLQRGHIEALRKATAEERGHYTRVFGDPLDWVRQRLGHRSVVTTQIYLHALRELESETRQALVPDDWDDPLGGEDAGEES